MEINLAVKCTSFEPEEVSECRVLLDALDHYKYNVIVTTEDFKQQYALDTLLHKLTLALLSNLETLPNKAMEGKGI